MVTRLSVIVVSIAALMSGCSTRRGPDERQAPGSAPPLEPCFIDGLSEEVRCGSFEMKEDRASDTSRRIRIQVTVVPALVRDRAADPFVVLAGGPGQGARGTPRSCLATFMAFAGRETSCWSICVAQGIPIP